MFENGLVLTVFAHFFALIHISGESCSDNPFSWGGCVYNAVTYVTNGISSFVSGLQTTLGTIFNCVTNPTACAQNALESALVALAGSMLSVVSGIFDGVLGAIGTVLDGYVADIESIALGAGWLAGPVFVLGFISLVAAANIAFAATKDTPILNTFV